MDFGGQTLCDAISLQGQVNVRLVLGSQNFVIKCKILVVDLALSQLDERCANVFANCGADSVLALDATIAVSSHKEVSSDHAWVIIPSLEIADGFFIDVLESESRSVVIDTVLCTKLESPILDLLLSLNHADNECFDDVKGGLRVVMGVLDFAWSIDQVVTAEKELGNVSAKVVHQVELATRMNVDVFLVQLEHQVVKNDQLPALCHLVIDLLGREGLDLALDTWGFNLALGVLVAQAVDHFEGYHEGQEDKHAVEAPVIALLYQPEKLVLIVVAHARHNAKVSKKQHDVAKIAMNLGDSFNTLFLCPRFVSFVRFHSRCRKYA